MSPAFTLKKELYEISSGSWETQDDFPFHSSISNAPSVYFDSGFIVFGGLEGKTKAFNGIYRFDMENRLWSSFGQLNQQRNAHNVIQLDTRYENRCI